MCNIVGFISYFYYDICLVLGCEIGYGIDSDISYCNGSAFEFEYSIGYVLALQLAMSPAFSLCMPWAKVNLIKKSSLLNIVQKGASRLNTSLPQEITKYE